jgi:CheY-like chemotaxis protein
MKRSLKVAKIIFIDDEETAVANYVAHLKEEGYLNVVHLPGIKTLKEIEDLGADLVFLDIAGVASALDPRDEGLIVLRHLRKVAPWTRVVVLSGSSFQADKVPDVAAADKCISKASLGLAELTELTEQELQESMAPAHRNARIIGRIQDDIEDLGLSWFKKRKLRKVIAKAVLHESDETFDWNGLVSDATEIIKVTGKLVPLLDALSRQ